MTQEQAKKLYDEFSENSPCKDCPHNSTDPQNGCSLINCTEYSFISGAMLGYNKALEDLKAPKTLAENRD